MKYKHLLNKRTEKDKEILHKIFVANKGRQNIKRREQYTLNFQKIVMPLMILNMNDQNTNIKRQRSTELINKKYLTIVVSIRNLLQKIKAQLY